MIGQIALLIFCIIFIIYNVIEGISIKRKTEFSFRELYEIAQLPILVGTVGNIKMYFLIDTGCAKSIIDSNSLSLLSPEDILDKIEYKSTVFGVGDSSKKLEQKVSLILNYNKVVVRQEFLVMDLSYSNKMFNKNTGININGILGNDFLGRYNYIINMEERNIYKTNKK